MGEPGGAPSFVYCAGWYPASPAFRKGVGVGLYRLGMARLFIFSFWFFFFLVAKSQPESVFDTLGLGMGFFELLRRAFEVSPHIP